MMNTATSAAESADPLARQTRRPRRRWKRFVQSRVKPVLIGLAAAAAMGVGLGLAARWLWD
jgi:hypothetical protein